MQRNPHLEKPKKTKEKKKKERKVESDGRLLDYTPLASTHV